MEHMIWNVNPNILEIGFLKLRWYGLLFVSSFFIGFYILLYIYKKEDKDTNQVEKLLIYIMLGAVIGSRLVHCFFYEPSFYINNPLEIIYIWKGGLASHGGLFGVFLSIYLFSKKYNESYIWILSRVTIPGALTATFIRFGNLFNSEILGKESQSNWAIIFERVDMIPRHPVQIYEAISYFLIFIILIYIYHKVRPSFSTKILPGVFLVSVFTSRFFIEYYKTKQSSYIIEIPFSTGQLLSVPYIIIGIIWIFWAFKTKV